MVFTTKFQSLYWDENLTQAEICHVSLIIRLSQVTSKRLILWALLTLTASPAPRLTPWMKKLTCIIKHTIFLPIFNLEGLFFFVTITFNFRSTGLPRCKNLWIISSRYRGYCLCAFGALSFVLCFTSLVSFTGFYTEDEPEVPCCGGGITTSFLGSLRGRGERDPGNEVGGINTTQIKSLRFVLQKIVKHAE